MTLFKILMIFFKKTEQSLFSKELLRNKILNL